MFQSIKIGATFEHAQGQSNREAIAATVQIIVSPSEPARCHVRTPPTRTRSHPSVPLGLREARNRPAVAWHGSCERSCLGVLSGMTLHLHHRDQRARWAAAAALLAFTALAPAVAKELPKGVKESARS